MRIDPGLDLPELDVRLEPGAGKIVGRSFHDAAHD